MNLPQKMGYIRWKESNNKMERRILHRNWDIQDWKCQVMKWEKQLAI